MSIFGRIFPIKDILARVPQLETQIEKLEKENETTRGTKNRSSFRKRCDELNKQIENQRTRISNLKMKEGSEDKQLAHKAMEKLKVIQNRLIDISDVSTTEPSLADETHKEEPKVDVVVEEEVIEEKPISKHEEITRQQSMYDEDDEEEDDAQIYTTAKPPQPQPRIIAVQSNTNETPVISKQNTGDEEDKAKQTEGMVVGNDFLVLGDFNAEEPGDLTVKKGEMVKIIQTRPDGWWTAKASKERIGLVPKTFLRHVPAEVLNEVFSHSIESTVPSSSIDKEEEEEADIERERTEEEDMGKSKAIDQESNLPQPSATSVPPLALAITRPIRCLGDALRSDPHLTYACHLTPRLSHSNLAFHDLYWNYEDDKLRKRHVRVSCLVRLIRFEGMPRDIDIGLVRIGLYDTSRKTGRQLVSNIHTIRAQVKGTTWTFISRADTASSGIDFGDFLLRSNYKMKDVVLLLEASTVITQNGQQEERALGYHRLSIIGDNNEFCLTKKTYTEILLTDNIFDSEAAIKRTPYKIVFKALDIPKDLVPFVDALPDVLLLNPMYIRVTYFYRRRAGTLLLRDRSNPLSAEMISDPLLAIFPYVADQLDLMDLITNSWNSKMKTMKNKSEVHQAEIFFHIFMNTAYCIHRTAIIPDYCIWDTKALIERQEVLKKCVDMLREYKTAARFLLTTSSKPINIYDYSLDIMGIHALD